ncbi:MAG: cyclic-phosphate processing receiver domain-containing protein [Planctomycetaceae bacterium]
MSLLIAILEDNLDRRAAMEDRLQDRFPQFERRYFANAASMVEFLETNLDKLALIALDHDLELIETGNGQVRDPDTGRDVADFLAEREPFCPIVIHTSNSPAAIGMQTVLQEAGWQVSRVLPFDDLAWIDADWFPTVRSALVNWATPLTVTSAAQRSQPLKLNVS